MAKAEFGSAKYLSNQMKARGLQKLRFYCQVCEKQCRDENGFKSHIRSPSHLRKISQLSEASIDEYTRGFESDFLKLLKISHGEKKIRANKFYSQFIQDKNHIHMNATRFTSLTKFVQHLSKEGKIRLHGSEDVPEEDMDVEQLSISYVDNSKENLQRKEALHELEINETSEQEINAKLLQRQIETCLKDAMEEEKNHEVPINASNSYNEHKDKVKIDLKASIKSQRVAKKRSKPKKKSLFN
ncbi:hypothetical protein HG535_0F05840 [Zygotorulaspora mrakii]|uniref:C2H2-type domain-containing protein n=1 Tax=Zygotorulaspora mrakii TaxID=42260 RepID=A0A7H9B8K9_ZYGMR|nr:uncharacterized protein HG535_0F05840 [Zygotorulaspora mrakii]QLG74072.1 hypothetical protein HG535_0F05840 [Zygotorulaspora mrakii]